MVNKMRHRPCPHEICNKSGDAGNKKKVKYTIALDCDNCQKETTGMR